MTVRTRTLARTAAILALAVVLLAGWLHQRWGGAFVTEAVDDLAQLAAAAFATGCAVLAARQARGRQRHSWFALAFGLAGWSAGEAIWCYYELLRARQTPFPSAADAGFLLFPIGAGVALLLFPARHNAHSRVRLILDGSLVAGSLFIVSWATALGSVYRAGADGTFAFTVSLAYPITDLITITMSVIVVARAQQAHRTCLALVGAGIALVGFSDSGFVYLTSAGTYASNLIDLGWVAGFAVLGIAAIAFRPAEPDADEVLATPSRIWLWLPYLPVLVAAVVGLWDLLPSLRAGPIPVVAMLVLMSLLARQLIVLAENRRLLLAISAQAFRDPLTGLANRALFTDRLAHAAERQRRQLSPLALLMLDLDRFKQINDTLGHAAGDELLVRVGERLTGALRATDTLARLGGDEFAVLIEDDAPTAYLLAERVADAFNAPFILGGRPHSVQISIGLAAIATDATGTSPDELLRLADEAMYSNKRSGRAIRVTDSSPRQSRPNHVQPILATCRPEIPRDHADREQARDAG